MNAKGITIGSWLYNKNGLPKQVTEVYDDSVTMGGELNHISTVEPIPLTGAILGKNGFEVCYNSLASVEYRHYLSNDEFVFIRLKSLPRKFTEVYYNPLDRPLLIDVRKDDFAVHELQNLFTMFDITKEIFV